MGLEILYAPLAHLPRSRRRQRSEQKGKYSSLAVTIVRQMGQRSVRRLRDTSDPLCNQIVVMGFGDTAAEELSCM